MAEVLATYVFVFFGTATIVGLGTQLQERTTPLDLPSLAVEDAAAIGLAFGFGFVVAVYAFGHVSGAHANPAVTVGLACSGRFPWRAVPLYATAQFVGAFLASLTVWSLFGEAGYSEPLSLGISKPAAGEAPALVAETVLTFLLLVTVMGTVNDERARPGSGALAIGFVISGGVLAAITVSGGSFNPARSLAPMILTGDFPGWWLYIVGPLVGGALGAVTYDVLIRPGSPPGTSGEQGPGGAR